MTTIGDSEQLTANSDELIERFRAFVKDDATFCRFIEACHGATSKPGCLRHWQEMLWQRFTEHDVSARSLSTRDILEAFRICHVHLLALKSVEVPIRNGMWNADTAREYGARIRRDAPYSTPLALAPTHDLPRLHGCATHVVANLCEACVRIRRDIDLMSRWGI